MQCICIEIKKSYEDIIQYVAEELKNLKGLKIQFSINKIKTNYGMTVVCKAYKIDGESDGADQKTYKILVKHVSNVLAKYVINQYEKKLMKRIINSNYCYFNAFEKKEILEVANRIMENKENDFFCSFFKIRRQKIIFKNLTEYFETSSNIVILEGFVNFRIKEYVADLEEIVDKSVNEFLMNREYKEFIRLLRYFIDIQESKIDIIHIVIDSEGRYRLLDHKLKEITNELSNESLMDIVNECNSKDITSDDILISWLITLAPKSVILHAPKFFKNKELLKTIQNIFSENLILCNECEICVLNPNN